MAAARMATAAMVLTAPATAGARPSGPQLFCSTYPDAPECLGRSIACAKCHTSTQPAGWNAFGGAVFSALGGPFEAGLPAALAAVESEDSDGDGLTNLEEIELGTQPGDPLSQWIPRSEPVGDGNDRYAIGEYDPRFAYRRVNLLFCGTSPGYDDLRAFDADDHRGKQRQIHDAVSDCLVGSFWVDDVLRTLANPKIRPVKAYGADTEVTINGTRITVADYEWDYRLWQYVLTEDRDARQLLTAQYHVGRDPDGTWDVVDGPIPNPEGFLGGGQPLQTQYRAGMLTTQWNLFLNVMFAPIPRVAAGHAYREYLGMDLARQQGIAPVAGEPLDLDAKGVDQPACAQCHSTLDPLAYAFAPYEGIDPADITRTGTYRPERPSAAIPQWNDVAPQTVVLGTEVDSLVQMAAVMADSPEFQQNLTRMLFVYAVGHEPEPDEYDEYVALWTALPADGYSVNRLIHRLVDTDAFGAP